MIKKIHPDYPIRIPNNIINKIILILNIFYKPILIIQKTNLRNLVPFIFLSLIHQIAYNYGIYSAKKMYNKNPNLMSINESLK